MTSAEQTCIVEGAPESKHAQRARETWRKAHGIRRSLFFLECAFAPMRHGTEDPGQSHVTSAGVPTGSQTWVSVTHGSRTLVRKTSQDCVSGGSPCA